MVPEAVAVLSSKYPFSCYPEHFFLKFEQFYTKMFFNFQKFFAIASAKVTAHLQLKSSIDARGGKLWT